MNMFSPPPPPEPENFDAPEYLKSVFILGSQMLIIGPFVWMFLQWVSR